MDFSVLNESSLHKTLKDYYAFQTNGKTEVKLNGHIYDILSSENLVIEIQTKNLAKLFPKLLDTLNKGLKVKLVHPIIINKKITTKDKEGNIISERKSPKKGSVYDLFRELTGIYPILLDKNFELEILEVNITELRTLYSSDEKRKYSNERHKKVSYKSGKKLNEIIKTTTFKSADDYFSLLPQLPEEFCAKDINNSFRANKNLPRTCANKGNLIIWVLCRMNLLIPTKVENRNHYYRINRA